MMQVITLVAVLGMLAQWTAWKLKIPALLLLMGTGLVLGPGFHVLAFPDDAAQTMQPAISLAVALILFEGGLTLRWHELQGVNKAIWRLVVAVGPLAAILGILSAYYVGGFSLEASLILGSLFVVTGPTVVIPLLRQANLGTQISRILRWEGIVNDPVGAMLAVIAFELVIGARSAIDPLTTAGHVFIGAVVAGALGFAIAKFFVALVNRSAMADYLRMPVLIATVMGTFVLADHIQPDSGLMAVTIMGIVLANSRLFCLEDILHFKESLAIFLTSVLFIFLSATISRETLIALDFRTFAFVFVMLVLVRPAAVWIGVAGHGLSWQEKLYISLIAPRGIVALSVAGYFSGQLIGQGIAGGEDVFYATFVMVLLSVGVSSALAQPLARRLGLARPRRAGIVVAGTYPWSAAFAAQLKSLNVPVLMVDENWRHLKAARMHNLSSYYGNLLSEYAEIDLDLTEYRHFFAATDNDAYNTLLCSHMGNRFDSRDIYQVRTSAEETSSLQQAGSLLRGKTAFGGKADWESMMINMHLKWIFRKTQLTETYPYSRFVAEQSADNTVLAFIDSAGQVVLNDTLPTGMSEKGVSVISYGPPKAVPDSKPAPESQSQSQSQSQAGRT